MNKNQKIILAVIAALIGGYFVMVKVSRGIRNNNPGNIRKSGDNWDGLKTVQTDDAFFQFISPVYGIRALAKILRNYQELYHLNTVSEIIRRYAPPSENNSVAYITHVALKMGVEPTQSISLKNETLLFNMISAIIYHENGSNPYDVETTFSAMRMV